MIAGFHTLDAFLTFLMIFEWIEINHKNTIFSPEFLKILIEYAISALGGFPFRELKASFLGVCFLCRSMVF
jgi:CDP-diglyceride synthetase